MNENSCIWGGVECIVSSIYFSSIYNDALLYSGDDKLVVCCQSWPQLLAAGGYAKGKGALSFVGCILKVVWREQARPRISQELHLHAPKSTPLLPLLRQGFWNLLYKLLLLLLPSFALPPVFTYLLFVWVLRLQLGHTEHFLLQGSLLLLLSIFALLDEKITFEGGREVGILFCCCSMYFRSSDSGFAFRC